MTRKQRFQDRPLGQKVALVIVGLLSLLVVGFAERDIQSRPDADVRGPKLVWRLASLNAVGALAYLGIGRR